MNWQVPRIWEGGEVWILGGGPSMTQQFNIPDDVVGKVRNGTLPPSTYSLYMEAIHNKHVIAINVAYLIGDWMDMVFFADSKFFLPHKHQLAEWPKLKVSCHSVVTGHKWVKYLEKDKTYPRGLTKNPMAVCWNLSSGATAINVAANAGAKRIILLGFDMKLDEQGVQHWHNLYKNEPRSGRKKDALKSLPFHKHLLPFQAIARDAKLRKIEIINASPKSAIIEFPKCDVKDLL